MVSIPVDVLREILEHLGKADLAKICLLNKICCSYSQDVLYRDLSCGELLCRTLAESTNLARRVRSFKTDFDYPFTADALRNMSSLRHLSISTQSPPILEGCTFKLQYWHEKIAFDFSIFLLSTTPIQKLTIHNTFLYPTTLGSLLAQSFPSLTHLSIDTGLEVVQPDFHKWLESLLIALVSLRNLTITCSSFSINMEYYPSIVKISDRIPHLEYFTYDNIVQTCCWKRVGKEWVIHDQEEHSVLVYQ